MATQLENPTQRAKPANTAARIDGYVSNQLKKTSRQVRVSDIATGSLSIVAFVLAFFLAIVIIDAWIWPLTFFARVASLCFLVMGIAAIAWFKLLPHFFKKINPQFAAKMIEETKPDFKNSLLNYLSLKKSPNKKKVHRAILNEVSRKAATDLSTVSPDAAVDKSLLIRTGFILVALVAVLIGYSIFSPKSPLPTFLRVMSPGSKIAHPAAVSISVLTPRDADVFFGDKPEVTAKVYGVSEQDVVHLVYSSVDSQIVDAHVTMKYTGENNTYAATLATGPSGIQQSLTYHVEAGDGASPEYSISVRPNPSITINSVRITPPKYTGLPERIIDGQGEIQAVEGASVEITATANLPIELAYIVPLIAKNQSSENTQFRELRTIQMKSEHQQATGRMTVGLNSNRDRALFSHYKINFLSKDNFKNERPNIYPIRVIADLAPEIEFVSPAAREVTTPVNQPLPIEIWASDLDYELSSIDMFVDHDGHQALEKNLFDSRRDKSSLDRVQARTSITPAELGLKEGDRAILYAVAADNRISSSSDLPDPNKTRSGNYTLIITAPVESQQKNDEPQNVESKDEKSEQDSEQNSEAGSDDSQSENQNDSDQSSGEQSNQQEGDSGEDNSSGSQDGAGNENGDTDQESETSQDGGENSGRSEENPESQADSDSESANSDDENNDPSKSGNASEQTEAADPQSSSQSKDGNEGEMTGSDDQQSSDGTTSAAGNENKDSNERGRQGNQDSANSDGQSGGDEFRDDSLTDGDQQQPLDKDAHPGEQIERLKEYFENKQKQENKNNPSGEQGSQENQENRRPGDADNNNSDNQKPTDPPDNPDQASSQDSAADGSRAEDAGKRENDPSQNSDARGGDDQRKPEEAADGNPEKPAKGGQESENGTPDQNNSGEGSESKTENGEQSGSSSDQQDSNPSRNSENSQGSDDSQSSSQQEGMEPNQDGQENSQSPSDNGQPSTQQDPDQNTGQASESSSQQPESNSTSNEQSQGDSTDATQNPGNKTQRQNESSVSEKGHRGGASGNTTSPNQDDPESNTPKKEKPNLDYAKKVTDLVLNQLEDQKYDPDQELLDQMNWTQQDLDEALRQWKQMKSNAESGNPAAQQKYTDWLESLGISPNTKSRTANVKKDKDFKLNESGAVDTVPREYLEEFNSFLRRRNRSKRQ